MFCIEPQVIFPIMVNIDFDDSFVMVLNFFLSILFVLFSEFCLLDKIRAGLLVASLSRTMISEVISSISVDNDDR